MNNCVIAVKLADIQMKCLAALHLVLVLTKCLYDVMYLLKFIT
jgi:hypothetical protein